MLSSKCLAALKLMRFDKPVGIFLLLWPTLWALLLASHGEPSTRLLVIFTIGTVLMRAAGCVINDFADRPFDGHVRRTRARPLVTGELSSREAIFIFFLLLVAASSLLFLLNWLCFYLALMACALTVIYPYCKRFIQTPQAVLGLAFSFGILLAYAATQNRIPFESVLLLGINYCWVLAYDTMYAMVDREDDLKIGVKSMAVYLDSKDKLVIIILQVVLSFLWLVIARLAGLKPIFYMFVAFATALLIVQQYLIKESDPAKCFKAFSSNHWYGLLMCLGIRLSF